MTAIEWTEVTWNPVTGCDRVSPGCDNCYALTLSARLKAMGQPKYQRDGDPRTSGPGFGLTCHPDELDRPLRWRKPRRVFVNSMSDLFHPEVPDDFIARVVGTMSAAGHHTFQCLTKRPQRMRALLTSPWFPHDVARQHDAALVDLKHDPVERWAPIPAFPGYDASTHGRIRGVQNGVLATSVNPRTGRETVTIWNGGSQKTMTVHSLVAAAHLPTTSLGGVEVCHRNGDKLDNRLANLRWGTRSENQREKVRHGNRGGPQKLTPEQAAAIKMERSSGRTQQSIADEYGVSRSLVSMIESGDVWAGPDTVWPLLNVWLGVSIESDRYAFRADHLRATPAAVRFLSLEPLLGPLPSLDLTGIDWVIVGGESGLNARPIEADWVRDLRDRSLDAGAAYFFKQWGGRTPKANGRVLDGRTWDEYPS